MEIKWINDVEKIKGKKFKCKKCGCIAIAYEGEYEKRWYNEEGSWQEKRRKGTKLKYVVPYCPCCNGDGSMFEYKAV